MKYEYKKKKILLQSGGTRNFYYKVTSNGKKKQISKIEYLNKKGGNLFDFPEPVGPHVIKTINELFLNRNILNNEFKYPYILITCGPTGSGKSNLIDKSLKYLQLAEPFEKNIFIIDNLVEEHPNYKIQSKQILDNHFSKNNTKLQVEQKIKNLLNAPIKNKNNSIFKEFTDAYFSVRGNELTSFFDEKLRSAIKNNDNFIIETTGRSFPSIIGWTYNYYKVFISYSLVEFCTLIDRNIKRMIAQLELFYKNNSLAINSLAPAPRLPDIRFQKFGEVVTIILQTLIKIIDKCNSGICKTNRNFHTLTNKPWTDKNFRLIIFDNTTSNNVPIFDSDDKSKNLDVIKKLIMNTYQKKNKCQQ